VPEKSGEGGAGDETELPDHVGGRRAFRPLLPGRYGNVPAIPNDVDEMGPGEYAVDERDAQSVCTRLFDEAVPWGVLRGLRRVTDPSTNSSFEVGRKVCLLPAVGCIGGQPGSPEIVELVRDDGAICTLTEEVPEELGSGTRSPENDDRADVSERGGMSIGGREQRHVIYTEASSPFSEEAEGPTGEPLLHARSGRE
jgi:hypothetical protein